MIKCPDCTYEHYPFEECKAVKARERDRAWRRGPGRHDFNSYQRDYMRLYKKGFKPGEMTREQRVEVLTQLGYRYSVWHPKEDDDG